MELLLFLKVLLSWGISNVFSLSEEKFYGFEDCIDVELTQHEGTFSSPFYPNNYPSHLSCSWHLKGNVGDVITVSIKDLDIEGSCCCTSEPCCSLNWLKIGPIANGTEKKLCGKELQHQQAIQSSSNKLYIKFHVSYFKDGGRGFNLHYKMGPRAAAPICKHNEFKCDNNQCVPSVVRCNTYPDCGDGSDEHHCANRCASSRSCRSIYQCYDTSQHCDGIADCPDFSDEIDCGFCARNQTRCGVNSTKCYNPLTQRCDRIFDCVNGEDEVDCSSMCPGKIMCDSKRGCYSVKQRCNGVTQCEDASDEKHCVSDLCNYQHGGFLCDNGRCIQEVWTCDRTDDCGDGSDERECLRNSVLTAALMGSLICALLLVIAISCTCRLHALRMLENRLTTTTGETPLSRMSREFFFREPPPSYAVAIQGDSPRNLCVENSHYCIPIHNRGHRSRSRRTRHSRGPYHPAANSVPVTPIRTAPRPPPSEPDVEMLDDTVSVSESCGQEMKDTVSNTGQESKDEAPNCCENVPRGGKQVNKDTNSDVGLDTVVSTSTTDIDDTVVSSDPHFYCDSDTDPLVV